MAGPSHPVDQEISERHRPRLAARLSRLLEGDHGGSENFLREPAGEGPLLAQKRHLLGSIRAGAFVLAGPEGPPRWITDNKSDPPYEPTCGSLAVKLYFVESKPDAL